MMKSIPVFTFLIFFISVCSAQQPKTISVKKTITPAEVRLDSTFTHLQVFDQLHELLDSSVVSFSLVWTKYQGAYYSGGVLVKPVFEPIRFQSNCSYLTSEMRSAFSKAKKGDEFEFKYIKVHPKGGKETMMHNFKITKP